MIKNYGDFSTSLNRLFFFIRAKETEAIKAYGLPGSCARGLSAVACKEEGLTVSQIAKYCVKDKATVSRVIATLEERGLVERTLAEGRSYRARIVLTDAGREVLDYVTKYVSKALMEAEGIKNLDEEKRKRLFAALNVIRKIMPEVSELDPSE